MATAAKVRAATPSSSTKGRKDTALAAPRARTRDGPSPNSLAPTTATTTQKRAKQS